MILVYVYWGNFKFVVILIIRWMNVFKNLNIMYENFLYSLVKKICFVRKLVGK